MSKREPHVTDTGIYRQTIHEFQTPEDWIKWADRPPYRERTIEKRDYLIKVVEPHLHDVPGIPMPAFRGEVPPEIREAYNALQWFNRLLTYWREDATHDEFLLVQCALSAGQLWERAHVRQIEPLVKSEKERRAKVSETGKSNARLSSADRVATKSKMQELVPQLSYNDAANTAGKEFGVTGRHVRRIFPNPNPNR